MATGRLMVRITDLCGDAVPGKVTADFRPQRSESGAGGSNMEASISMGSATALEITGISCRGGPGTLYRVEIRADHFRPYAFFQMILENRANTASDTVRLWIEPGEVRDIRAPEYAELPARLRSVLDAAQMKQEKSEDRDLAGATGADLYGRLGPLRKSCLLNVFKKASHNGTTAGCFRFVRGLMMCRQDRIFAEVEAGMPEFLRASELFKSAPNTLHDAPTGYHLEDSFKSRDAHANLQVTFLRDSQTGGLAADIDIDESSGIEHGFEVIRNAVFRKRTNPYLIREFLLAADPVEKTLDPSYRFVC